MKGVAKIFREEGWGQGFVYWWIVCLGSVLLFDIFWMMQTTFRPMSYFTFYPVLFLSAFILAWPTLIWRNGIVQALWLLLIDTLFIANLMYCRTYYNAIPLHSYLLAGNLADFKASVADSFKWYFVFLPVLTLTAFAVYTLARKGFPIFRYPNPRKIRPLRNNILVPYCISILFLSFLIWISDAWRGGIMKRMEMMSEYAYLSSSITPIYSLGGFLIHDYFKTNEQLTPEEEKEVNGWLSDHDRLSAVYWNDSTRAERKVPKNLVLIFCESLESWVLERDVEGKELMPNLNRLISDSTTFYAPKVVTQVGSGRSIDAQLLIMAGLMPMRSQAYAYDAIENDFFTLPKAMKGRRAKTILFTCDKPYVWNQALVAKAFGIDSLIYAKDFKIDETAGPSRRLSDGSFFRQITEKLQNDDIWQQDNPVMLVAVTYSGHNPFNLPNHLRTISFSGDYPEIIKNYMITAHYTDASLQTLIDYLKSRDDWEDTMVVITGDHEGLASDRAAALSNPNSKEFVDPGQHTPLIILNSPVTGRLETEIGQVDVYTTLLDLMGLSEFPWRGLGFSAFTPAEEAGISSFADSKSIGSAIDSLKAEAPRISDLILKFNMLSPAYSPAK